MMERSITAKEFKLFQELIFREAGIYLSNAKEALLVGRLGRRLRELNLSTFKEYYELVASGNEQELVCMLDCICTNETHFFREPQHFEFLREHVFPEWEALADSGLMQKRIRIWSAGCSTGEEPYSLAMTLLDHLEPAKGWEGEILATDLSTRVLKRAQEALWPLAKSTEIPSRYLKRYMLKGVRSQEGKMRARPEIRSMVQFHRLNLNDKTYPQAASYDLIFCRNVLIYFNTESRSRVIHRILDRLAPGGYLFLGHAESLNGQTERVRNVIPTVYALANKTREATAKAGVAGSAHSDRAR